MMDETALDALLDRLREVGPSGAPPDPGAVWRGVDRARIRATRRRQVAWMASGIAAAALVGVGIGRLTAPSNGATLPTSVQQATAQRTTPEEAQLDLLAETSANLFTAVVQREPTTNDSVWAVSVANMLWTTRQLLGTPALDASRQAVLQDLEMVLVQLLGASSDPDPIEMDLAREAIQLRDLLPRLGALRVATVPGGGPDGEAT